MNFPPLNPPRVLLHVVISGKPFSQKRHRVGGTRMSQKGRFVPRMYDPSSEDKEIFLWALKSACPTLRPNLTDRLGVTLKVWTRSKTEDWDNFSKFYCDAMSPPKSKHRHRKGDPPRDLSKLFCVWGDDRQVDDAHVHVYRGAVQERVEILVYVLE